jgi:hypothetical protein
LSVVEGTSRTEAVPEIEKGHGCRPLVNGFVSDIAMKKERGGALCLCCIVSLPRYAGGWLVHSSHGPGVSLTGIHGVSIHSRTLPNDYLKAPGCGEISLLLPLCSACELSDATTSGQGRLDTSYCARCRMSKGGQTSFLIGVHWRIVEICRRKTAYWLC